PDGDPANPGVDVRWYDLTARLDPASGHLEARLRLGAHHPDTLTRLSLDFLEMDVDTVPVDGRPVDAWRVGRRLVVPLAGGRDSSVVEMHYAGVPPEGLYRTGYQGIPVAYTDSWPDRVAGWMPGVHHPSDPAVFTLTLDVPLRYEAVGTGLPVAVDTLGG